MKEKGEDAKNFSSGPIFFPLLLAQSSIERSICIKKYSIHIIRMDKILLQLSKESIVDRQSSKHSALSKAGSHMFRDTQIIPPFYTSLPCLKQ